MSGNNVFLIFMLYYTQAAEEELVNKHSILPKTGERLHEPAGEVLEDISQQVKCFKYFYAIYTPIFYSWDNTTNNSLRFYE